MDPNECSPTPSSHAGRVNVSSEGSVSADEFYSFCGGSSLNRSRGLEDVTLQQLATAKETFTDLEVAYKNFKHEMQLVKEEHWREVSKLNAQVEHHAKQKLCLEEQLRSCKSESRKFQEELMIVKRNLAERDWEKETMSRELASHNTLIDKLRGERELLEGTIARLNQDIATSRMPTSTPPDRTGEDNKELEIAKQEVTKWEADYNYALEEKEAVQAENAGLQNELANLQTNCEKMQRELHFSNKASNMKVSKLEVQIQKLTKQRDHTMNQLEEARKEQRKSKEVLSLLQRDVIDAEQKSETFKEELNLTSKQVERLESVNRAQEIKVDGVKQECSRQQAAIEMYSRQRSSFDSDIREFESSISELETSLQMAKNEKDDIHRELYSSSSKLIIVQESYQKARERSHELEQLITNLKEGMAQLESDVMNERSKSFHVESAYNQLRVEVDELTVELDKASTKMAALESDYDTCLHERDDYKDTSSLSERKISELKTLLQNSEDTNNELDEKISTIKGQTWKLESQFDSATKQKKKMKLELDEERSKVSKLKKELLATQSRYNEHQRSVEWHKRDTAAKDKSIEDLRTSLSSADKMTESFYDEIDKLQAKIEVVEGEKREFHEETLSAQKRTKETQAEHALITDENERLHSEMQAFYKRISEMQTSYNVCEREKHDFQQQGMILQHKVNKLEEDLEESVKKISSFELQVQELTSEKRKSGEAVAMYKAQSAEQQGTCEELRQLSIEREALIEQLRETTAVLHAEAGSYRTELSHYKSLCEDFEQEKKSIQNELKAKQVERSRLNSTNEATLKRKEQLEYDLCVAQKKVTSMEYRKSQDKGNKRELELELARTTGLEKELSSLKMKFNLMESQFEVNQKDLHGVLEEIELAQEKITSLTLEIERVTTEKNEESRRALSVENKCSELENEISTCLHSKEIAEEDVLVMSTRVAKYESQIKALQKQKASIKEQLDTANNDLTKQKEEVVGLESQVTESKKVNETLNSMISKKESLVQELQGSLADMECDLKTVRQEMIYIKAHCEGTKADKTECEQRIVSCQDKVKGYEQELYRLQETKTALEQEINTKKFQTTSLERQLKAALKDKEHYKSEYHNSQTTVRNVKEETLALHNHLREKERKCEAYAADIKEKGSELEKVSGNNVALKNELLEVREDLETMRYNFENSQHIVEELEASLSEANDSISKLDLSIENLHQEKRETSVDNGNEKYLEMEALLRKSQEKEHSIKQEIQIYKTRIDEMETKRQSEQHENLELSQVINTLQRKIHDSEIILERYEREKRTLKEELMLANSRASDLEVKCDYESRERESTEKQLHEARERTASNREKLLTTEQQVIEQRLALEFTQREIKERDNSTVQLQASKIILEEQIASLTESLAESREVCERMKGEQGTLQREILDQCSSIANSDARVQKITLERDRVLAESHSCMSNISSLEQQVVEMGREKERLLSSVDEWKQSCTKHREAAVNSQNKIAEYENKIASLVAQITKKDSLVQELSNDNNLMGKEMESLRSHSLLSKLIETKSNSSQLDKQVQTLSQENKKEKEMVENVTARIAMLQKEIEYLKQEMSSKDFSNTKNLARIKALESELKGITNKSVVNVNLCEEKENLICQLELEVREVKMKCNDLHREKEFLIQEGYSMEHELRAATERISEFESRSMAEARAEKEYIVLKEKLFQLGKEYDRVTQERTKLEVDAEAQRKALQEEKNHEVNKLEREIREVEFYKARSEELSCARETLNREKLFLENEVCLTRDKALECETRLEMKKKRIENELNILGEKYAELQGKYYELLEMKQKLEEVTEIRVRSESLKKEESVYKLERDIRGLRSENEYYEKVEDGKYASMNELRRKISRLETENEYLRKHIFIAVESYDKAEKKLKRIQSTEYEPVITYQIRQAIREASDKNGCDSLDSSTASLSLFHQSISSPRVDCAGPKIGRSPTRSSTPKPGHSNTSEGVDTKRITSASVGRSGAANATSRRGSGNMRMQSKGNSGRTSEECSSHLDSVFSSPSVHWSASKQDGSPGGTKVHTAFPF